MLAQVTGNSETVPGPAALAAFDAYWRSRVEGHSRVPTDQLWPFGGVRLGAGSSNPDVGPLFGSYRVLREVGGGGQGRVFRAYDERLRRPCALKLLHATHVSTEDGRERFVREGRLAARIDHPNVCRVFESGIHDGVPYLATQWIDGEPLDRWLRDRPPAGTEQERSIRLDLVVKIAEAVAAAHAAGVVHRDVKPGNVLVSPAGEPIVVDFGLASETDDARTRLTRTGQVFGTLGYMAPEQSGLVDARPDARSDVFAVGILAAEILCGELPYPAESRVAYEAALRKDRRRGLRRANDFAPGLDAVLDRALQVEPEDRFQSMAELVSELRRAARGQQVQTRRRGLAARTRRWVRREPGLAGAVVAILLTLSIALAISLLALQRARRSAYDAGLAAASAAAESGDVWAARARLEECPVDLRAWDWNLLDRRLDPTTSVEASAPFEQALRGARAAAGNPVQLLFDAHGDEPPRIETWDPRASEPRAITRLPHGSVPDGVPAAIAPDGSWASLDSLGADLDLAPGERPWALALAEQGRALLAVADAESGRHALLWIEPDDAPVRIATHHRTPAVRALGIAPDASLAAWIESPATNERDTTLHLAGSGGRPLGTCRLDKRVDPELPVQVLPMPAPCLGDHAVVVAFRDGSLAVVPSSSSRSRAPEALHVQGLRDGVARMLGSPAGCLLCGVDDGMRRLPVGEPTSTGRIPFAADCQIQWIVRTRGTVAWLDATNVFGEFPAADPTDPTPLGDAWSGLGVRGETPLFVQRRSVLRRAGSRWEPIETTLGAFDYLVAAVGPEGRLLAVVPAEAPASGLVFAVARADGSLDRLGLPFDGSMVRKDAVRAVSLDRNLFALDDPTNRLFYVCDVTTRTRWSWPLPRGLRCCSLAHGDDLVLLGFDDGRLALHDFRSGRPITQLSVAPSPLRRVGMVGPDDRFAVAIDDTRLHVVDFETGRVTLSLRLEGGDPSALGGSPDGTLLTVGTAGGMLHLLDGAPRQGASR